MENTICGEHHHGLGTTMGSAPPWPAVHGGGGGGGGGGQAPLNCAGGFTRAR